MSRQDETAARRFLARQAVGAVIDGTVERIVEVGAFVEVHEGVHGLLHSSEWTERPEPGTTVRLEILDIDVDGHAAALHRRERSPVSGTRWCRPACRGPGPRPCTATRRAGCRRCR